MITTSVISAFMLRDLAQVYSNMSNIPEIYADVYEIRKSDKNFEIIYEAMTLNTAQEVTEGGTATLSTYGQLYPTQFNHRVYMCGTQISRIAYDDNIYKDEFPRKAENQRNSIDLINNINGARPFNEAFNPTTLLADGQPFASINHPTVAGTYANTFPQATGLNESSLEAAWSLIRYIPNYQNQFLSRWVEAALIPPTLEMSALRAIGSPDDPQTAARAINPVHHSRMVPNVISNVFLTSPDNWFLLTNQRPGAVWFNRDPFEAFTQADNYNQSATLLARIRNSQGIVDPRFAFCVRG